jgi:hypothetical protein
MEALPWVMILVFVLLVGGLAIAIPTARIAREEYKKTGKRPKGYYVGLGLAFGIGIGMPLGAAIGNISLGPALGLPIGFAIGSALEKKNEDKLRPLTEREIEMKKKSLMLVFGLLIAGMLTFTAIFFLVK